MQPVIFHPADNVNQETKTDEKPIGRSDIAEASSALDMPSVAILELPEATTSARKSLPSLEIPFGTVGKTPKSHSVKSFVKALIASYIIATVAGLVYVILLVKL